MCYANNKYKEGMVATDQHGTVDFQVCHYLTFNPLLSDEGFQGSSFRVLRVTKVQDFCEIIKTTHGGTRVMSKAN